MNIVLVTGGARGIGRRIAQRFGQQGDRVYICDVDEHSTARTVADLQKEGLDIRGHVVDLSVEHRPQGMVRDIARTEGRIDVLINNAQSKARRGFFEETGESWDAGQSVTLKAAFFAAQEAVGSMRRSGGGAIVNIASIAGLMATHESASYHVAKAGLVHMTRYLAYECGKFGVRANCICPGFIVQDEHRERFNSDSNAEYRMLAKYCHPSGDVGGSDDVADCAAYLCSDGARFINGQVIVLDGGATIQEPFSLLHGFATRPRG